MRVIERRKKRSERRRWVRGGGIWEEERKKGRMIESGKKQLKRWRGEGRMEDRCSG